MAYMRIRDMIALHHSQYLTEESYPVDKVAAIVKTTDEWGIFGNFYKHPAKGGKRAPMVIIDGMEAQGYASRCVGFMGSKGVINAEKQ